MRNLDPAVFEPALASNLTRIIQGLVVLFVSTDVLVVYLWRLRRRAAAAEAAREPRVAARSHDGRMSAAGAHGRLGRHRARHPRVLHRRAADPGALAGAVVLLALAAVTLGALRSAAARGGSAGARSSAGVFGIAGGSPRRGRASTQPQGGRRLVGALLAATLRYATPLIFGALGGLFSERSGVINIGLEGMMLMGAFFGALGADVTGSWCSGMLIGIAAGATALIHAVFAVTLRADQIVSGFALNLLALGITGYLYIDIYGDAGHAGRPARGARREPADRVVPFFGDIFGQLNLLVWLALRARAGRRGSWCSARRPACGCARSARTRWPPRPPGSRSCARATRAVMASGALAAMGGAFLSIGFVHSFSQNMTAGRGLHRARGADLRALEAAAARSATLLFGFGRRSRSGCRCSRPRRDALPGAAVRAHADRGRRADRTLDPAGSARAPTPESWFAARPDVESSGA